MIEASRPVPVASLLALLCVAVACGGGEGGGGAASGGAGGGGGVGGGGAGSGGAPAGGAGGEATFVDCAGCAADGLLCLDGSSCAADCPGERMRCGGAEAELCCPEGSLCCSAAVFGLAADLCAPAGEGCPLACPDGVNACPLGRLCAEGGDGAVTCVDACEGTRCGFNGCCAPGLACEGERCVAPDLSIDAAGLVESLRFERQSFTSSSCEVVQGCVSGEGERVLLSFEALVQNLGAGDVPIGVPGESPLLQLSLCEQAYVLQDFIGAKLLDPSGAVVAETTLDTTCLEDGDRVDPAAGLTRSYSCTAQGLSRGWSDLQPNEGARCRALDVTDAPPGDYVLELTLDPRAKLPDSDRRNDVVRVPVTKPDLSCRTIVCDGVCCPNSNVCGADGGCALPDLTVDAQLLQNSLVLEERNFPLNDCAIEEGCIVAGGERRLLRFSTSTPNLGDADFFVGDPRQNPNAVFSACHGHFHYYAYASYRLLAQDGTVAAIGHKQAFCLIDVQQYEQDAPPRRYTCDFQGVTRGWADVYGSGLDCQWIDITGVPAGDYVVEITVNPERVIEEKEYGNNVATAQVTIPADPHACVPSPELCGDGHDQNCDGVADEGCPPLVANETCDTAHPIDGSASFAAEIGAATTADGAPSCGGAQGGDLFFRFEVLSAEYVHLTTYGSTLDTVLSLQRTDCAQPDVACADDLCGTSQEQLLVQLQPGIYYVSVKAKQPGATGLVALTLERSGCGEGALVAAPGVVSGNTVGQGLDVQTSCGTGAGPDVYHVFATCPGPGAITANACGSSFDTVLELRPESCRNPGVACNDDAPAGSCASGPPQASIVTQATEGAGMWFLVVDGFAAASQGAYSIDLQY